MVLPTWLTNILDVVTDEVVLEPLILLAAGYMAREYRANRKLQAVADLTLDLVDFIEEHYEEWGIRGPDKMQRFLDLFREEFHKRMGYYPKQTDLESARIRAEAYVQRARREQIIAQVLSGRRVDRRPSLGRGSRSAAAWERTLLRPERSA